MQGLPLLKPPYGILNAIDLDKGEIKWQVPHGDTPDAVRNSPLLRRETARLTLIRSRIRRPSRGEGACRAAFGLRSGFRRGKSGGARIAGADRGPVCSAMRGPPSASMTASLISSPR